MIAKLQEISDALAHLPLVNGLSPGEAEAVDAAIHRIIVLTDNLITLAQEKGVEHED